ncbi:hypothetical protein DFP73DRAFT_508523 [Morchella snyderi]|nr:hypothetical protein DFP73DRAFT_508523 [Morchella snyderi]
MATAATTTTTDQSRNSEDNGIGHRTIRARHRRNTSAIEPDPRFYSGRNPVPRIESLWTDVYANERESSPENNEKREEERKRKAIESSKKVVDPITGRSVQICDAKYAPPPEIEKTQPEVHPPQAWHQFMEELRNLTLKYIVFVMTTFIILNGCLPLPYSISIFITIAGGVTWWRNVESVWTDIIHNAQTTQGVDRMHTQGSEGNESAEWLNGTIAKLWPQVNADLFSSMVDLLEDVMQASIPSIVNEVKVTNVGQGTNPIRILSLRWLNESEVPGGPTERLNEQEEVGEWAALEVAFAYRASPSGSSAASKAKNANLLIHLTFGVKGVMGTPIPVWVELRGCTGICRVKIQLIPDPPFVKLATFSFMGMPKIEIAAVPLNQRFFNVMNLPVISDFINSSIKTAAKEFVAPSNYTLDLSKILVGEDTKKDLLAIGVLVVHINCAEAIRAADINGKSDCYVTLSYSKYAKPLWSTRIIFGDLNPVWDETAILLVNADEVKASEKLSVTLWDSDRFTADDIVGRTEVDVTELVRNRGQLSKRRDRLQGFKDGHYMPGHINWSVVFHGKRDMNQDLATSGIDERLPGDFEESEEFKSKNSKVDSEQETRVGYIPPDPAFPAGILSIQIHNIIALERHSTTGSKGRPASRRGGTSNIEEEEADNLPSAYCSIILDQEKIYKTRVKPMTSKPFFNAGTERFVRDFNASTVLIVVSDSRMREIDPILGVVEFKLKDVLKNSSMISRYYPIQGGIGYGKMRVSLLFRSIDAQLPRPLLGSSIGTIRIISKHISSAGITDKEVREADYITFQTPLVSKRAPQSENDNGWSPVGSSRTPFGLGVRNRHSVPLILYFRRDSKLRRDKTYAAAVLWLKDIPDEEDTTVKLDVYQPQDLDGFIQNCGMEGQVQKSWGKHVGRVELVVRFNRGLAMGSRAHLRAAEQEKDFADVLEAQRCITRDDPNVTDSSVSSDSEGGIGVDGTGGGEDDDEDTSGVSSDEGGETGGIGGLKRRFSKKRDMQRELHKRERGVMQWKGARTLAWVGKGVKDAGKGVKGHFKMEPRRPNVETEVP